jgi:NAD(P)-dependent dehydrogenase (short-subunit alcohol dehydrogenase family)
MVTRILITGANRGIGLELVRQYAQQSATQIIATCRQPAEADELRAVQTQYTHVHILPLDVNDETAIQQFPAQLATYVDGLDLLINNAGINPKIDSARTLGSLTAATLLSVFQTNAVGALLVTQACLPLLQRGTNARVVMVSSQMGSLDYVKSGGGYAYKMSKAGMNMAARALAGDLGKFGITTITLHPGWVQTDMGGASGELTPTQAVTDLLRLFDRLTPADNGKFYKWNGAVHLW